MGIKTSQSLNAVIISGSQDTPISISSAATNADISVSSPSSALFSFSAKSFPSSSEYEMNIFTTFNTSLFWFWPILSFCIISLRFSSSFVIVKEPVKGWKTSACFSASSRIILTSSSRIIGYFTSPFSKAIASIKNCLDSPISSKTGSISEKSQFIVTFWPSNSLISFR